MTQATIDDDLEARVRAAFDEMVPRLLAAPRSQAAQPSRARPFAAALVVAATVAGAAVLAQRSSETSGRPADSTVTATDESATTTIVPAADLSWLRSIVPERFSLLAMTSSEPDRVTYVAIEPTDGKSLEIVVAAGASLEEGADVDAVGSWAETAQGWSVTTPAGVRAEISCNIGVRGRDFPGPPNYCELASTNPVPKAELRDMIGEVVAAGRADFGVAVASTTPPQSVWTDAAAGVLDGQELIGDTDWGTGDHVWDYAAESGRPDTSIRMVTGLTPAPDHRTPHVLMAGNAIGLYDDAAAFWVVDPSGIGVRISTVHTDPADLDALYTLADDLLDAVAGPSTVEPGIPTTTIAPMSETTVSVAPGTIRLLVANASTVSGVAGQLTYSLMHEYDVREATNATVQIERSIVYFAGGYEDAATELAARIGGADIQPMPDDPPIEGGLDSLRGPDIVDPAGALDLLVLLGNDRASEMEADVDTAVTTTTVSG
ncbi:MAG: LytR C-terminal domain-containing protein [Ilumatobacteraceae bacterium]